MLNQFSPLLFIFLFFGASYSLKAQDLPRSHAHNDYEKLGRKSLYGALKQGFRSIEIDVFVRGEKGNNYKPKNLRIAHINLLTGLCPTLESRYFARVENWLERQPRDTNLPPIILMVDIKNKPAQAYAQLRQLCQKYAHLLCVYYPNEKRYQRGAVQILLSGSKPVAELRADSVQYMWLDMGFGTIGDNNTPPQLAPRVSSHYGGNFKWRGRGGRPMPPKELEKLQKIVAAAHADGREVRFWAMPNRAIVWRTFSAAGVDWLNIDKIKKYRRWQHL
jgi:glycerophosphoryl diester phosphodiesterase